MGAFGSLFWTAFALGLAFSAPPGAVTAEALRRGLLRGFSGAFLVEVGSLVGDATWAIIALSGAAYVVASRPASLLLAGIGAVMLFRLAYSAVRDAWRGRLPEPPAESRRGDFAAGAVISIANPFAVAFWLGLGGSLATMAGGRPHLAQYAVFLGAFMLGATFWCFFISGMIGWARRALSPGFFRLVGTLCGAALAYYGCRLVVRMIGY